MGLNDFKKAVETQVVNPALAKQSGLKSGLIMNATYNTDVDLSIASAGGGVILDIVMYDDGGNNSQIIKAVPLIKIPGFSQSLPPIGSTAVIAFLDGDQSSPVCIGIIPNELTNKYTSDHLTPRVPPKKMSK
jgi:hypothetical protein